MTLFLSLNVEEIDADELQDLTRQLCCDLRDEANLDAELATKPAEENTKGSEWEVIGQIAIKSIGAGGAIALTAKGLFEVLKVYAARKPTVEIQVHQSKTSKKVIIKATDILKDEAQVKSLLAEALKETE